MNAVADTQQPKPQQTNRTVALLRRFYPRGNAAGTGNSSLRVPAPASTPLAPAGPAQVVPGRLGPMGDDLLAPDAPTVTHELARGFLEVAETGFAEDYDRILAEDVVYLVPGRSRVAGLKRGKAAVMDALTPAPSGRAPVQVTWCEATELMTSNDRAMVIIRLDGSIGPKSFSYEVAFHLQIRDDRIVAITEYSGDQYLNDEVIGP